MKRRTFLGGAMAVAVAGRGSSALAQQPPIKIGMSMAQTGGLAGEICAVINELAFDDLDAPITRIASLDTPVPFSPPLEKFFLPKVEDVVREARRLKAY